MLHHVMFFRKSLRIFLIQTLIFMNVSANAIEIKHNRSEKSVIMTDGTGNLQLALDYNNGVRIRQLTVKGRNTISSSGVYTSIKTGEEIFTSSGTNVKPKISVGRNKVTVSSIIYGDDKMPVSEKWMLTVNDSGILWEIRREYKNSGKLDNMSIPVWNFCSMDTWKGGILNTGGVVWCKYLGKVNDTYGVHTNGALFWQPASGDGLMIEANSSAGNEMACSFSHSEKGEFSFTQYLTPEELGQRYNLSRFVNAKPDVFSPFNIYSGIASVVIEIKYVDYKEKYDRGNLPGIDAEAVRELLNTTGRYGVLDRNIMGANGWVTNWKVLDEPFFAQMGMAVDDDNYIRNFASTLNRERDMAIEKDGRVLHRWHDVPEVDKSNYDFKTGYYDCPWGPTLDAQPSQIINTVELFHQTGDLEWLKSHKMSCEKVLNWLIKRDSDNDGLFEMMNDNISEKKCSDWLDVIWASYENAFVNALMFEALNLWADCENILGDEGRSEYYSRVASRLKDAFNKPVQNGGFWYQEKKQYIHWRDKDGSLHGDNLVTPVNFAAIAFGICDDPERISLILDQIEEKTSKENLFHWPLCFESYRKEEVYEPVNWPFPNYENGDIFPTWGYLGVRSYIKYKKEIALKYIQKILNQYNIDGLSSQRFSRREQKGIGTDILAGTSTTITALYRDIYGIRPKWNRFGLEPNMMKELNGTDFYYTLRGIRYNVKLNDGDYKLTCNDFSVEALQSFGVSMNGNSMVYYPGNKNNPELLLTRSDTAQVKLKIITWNSEKREWIISSTGDYSFVVSGLKPGSQYRLKADSTEQSLTATSEGELNFEYVISKVINLTLME